MLKNPNRCDDEYTGASSSKIRFWSALPPRTLNPLDASPTVLTPGKRVRVRTMSVSPNSCGIFLISLLVSELTDISVVLTLLSSF